MLTQQSATLDVNPESLLKKIQSGDLSAEQQLVSIYWRSLYFILNKRTNDPDLSEDLAQEAFIVVITKARAGEIEKPEALASFIRQVGVNLMIANYRKEKRRNTETSDEIEVQFPDSEQTTANKLNSKQVCQVVNQVMEELPTERDREILRRYFIYGQEKSVICEEYELKAVHFDRVLFRARSRLKQLIQHKLKVDLSQVSLSHLISIAVCLTLLTHQSSANNFEFSLNSVREPSVKGHLPIIELKERALFQKMSALEKQNERL